MNRGWRPRIAWRLRACVHADDVIRTFPAVGLSSDGEGRLCTSRGQPCRAQAGAAASRDSADQRGLSCRTRLGEGKSGRCVRAIRAGGCGFARHGTYPRKTPPGMRVTRYYCPTAHETFSLLPDCLASRFPSDLDDLERVVTTAATAPQCRSGGRSAAARDHAAVGRALDSSPPHARAPRRWSSVAGRAPRRPVSDASLVALAAACGGPTACSSSAAIPCGGPPGDPARAARIRSARDATSGARVGAPTRDGG